MLDVQLSVNYKNELYSFKIRSKDNKTFSFTLVSEPKEADYHPPKRFSVLHNPPHRWFQFSTSMRNPSFMEAVKDMMIKNITSKAHANTK